MANAVDMFKTLNDKDLKLLAGAWLAMPDPPKPDYDELAKYCGYTKGSAQQLYGQLRRKMLAIKSGSGDVTASPNSTKKKASPKKRATGEDDDDEDTPKKKKAKGGKKGAKVKEEVHEDPNELDEDLIEAAKQYPFDFE